VGFIANARNKKAAHNCTAPKKLDTYWGHFYGNKKKIRF
jgi:hypothetical protein